jgi:transcription antitermination factor NusG
MWYVIQTKPKKEIEASSYLSVKGVEIYRPLLEAFTDKDGRLKRGVTSLFPGYIFGNFDYEEDYNLVKWARGVKTVLGNNGVPTPISDTVVEEIKSRSGKDGVVRMPRDFEPEDRVRIKSGLFKDFVGMLESWVPEKERVRILLNLIGYQPQVELHFSQVEKLN